MAYRPKDTQERILHRLKIVRGHLNSVIKMVEDNKN
jgi:DNA-binding FrmR family transcriptional regulator